MLRNIPNDYSYKKAYLDKHSNTIECLFLGSSHAYSGIDPSLISLKSFNASHVGQTINFDYMIFERYKNKWKNLKFIIIPIDYFTLLTRYSKDLESWRIKNYNIYYNLQNSFSLKDNSELLSFNLKDNIGRIISYYIKDISSITCSNLGYDITVYENKDLAESAEVAAKRHTIPDFSSYKNNLEYLNKFIQFATKNNVQIIFYTSPAYNTYRSLLNKDQLKLTIDVCNDIVKHNTNCSYYNFMDSKNFNAFDFRDADHLNKNGAGKLSGLLNSIINQRK